jgi:hypothetical protein
VQIPDYIQESFGQLQTDTGQRSDFWFEQRRGKVTASEVFKVLTNGRKGESSKTRRTYAVKLASERLSGKPSDSVCTAAMIHGREQEESALKEFELLYNVKVEPVTFVANPDGSESGVSPDGFVGQDATVEVKCKHSENHLEIILSGKMPDEHIPQVQMQLMVTKRKFCYFISYDPRFEDEHLRLFVVKVERDEEYIAKLETEIKKFLVEVQEIVDVLKAKEK